MLSNQIYKELKMKSNKSIAKKLKKLKRKYRELNIEKHEMENKLYHLEKREQGTKEDALAVLYGYVGDAKILIDDYDYDQAAGKLEYIIEHLLSINDVQQGR